jgi:membrane protease YdiL (CAAX protease family)|tara:strand:+ start:291 stop:1046 length:756 start_codon:yes stop_codon:yes gene_type:complete
MPQPLRFAKQSNPNKKSYSELSKQPLYMLLFLLPLIIFYEVALYSSSSNIQIKAHAQLLQFLEQFDFPTTQGLWLGGIAIITILLIWHIATKNKWSIKLYVLAFMACESVALAIPLLLFGSILGGYLVASQNSIPTLALFDKIAISIGAGLYEELIFRMILIGGIHTIVRNIFNRSDIAGFCTGVLASSLLFALYHDLPNAGTLSAPILFFFFAAGCYLGFLYIIRDFGIAAGTHAAYDVVATALLASLAQ